MARPKHLHKTITARNRKLFIQYLFEAHQNLAQIHTAMTESHGVKDYDVLQIGTALRKLKQFQLVILAIPECKE